MFYHLLFFVLKFGFSISFRTLILLTEMFGYRENRKILGFLAYDDRYFLMR